MIFLSIRFYVTSILGILEVQNLPFLQALYFDLGTYMDFCTFLRLKLTKLTKSRAPTIAKMAVLEFHVKSK